MSRLRRAAGALGLLVLGWLALFAVLTRRRPRPLVDGTRRFNRWVLNPVMLRVAGRRHWYAAALHHAGRRSGTRYTTPVVAEPLDGTFVIPLPYGTGVDWLRNILASGDAELDIKGVHHRLVDPVVLDAAAVLPRLPDRLRRTWRRLGIESFVEMRMASAPPEMPAGAVGEAS